MPARPVRSFDEMCEILRDAPPPTADDVWITRDGERLETAEKIIAHVQAISARNAQEDAAKKDGPAA